MFWQAVLVRDARAQLPPIFWQAFVVRGDKAQLMPISWQSFLVARIVHIFPRFLFARTLTLWLFGDARTTVPMALRFCVNFGSWLLGFARTPTPWHVGARWPCDTLDVWAL